MPDQIKEIIITVSFIFLALAGFIIFFIVLFTRKKNKLIMQNHLLEAEHKQQLLQTQIEIQEQTLKTISQEIHDNVGQVLSLAKLNLGTFEQTENAFNQARINDTKQLVSKAINDLRDLSRSLYGNKIAELGLSDAIDNELKILQNSGQFKTSFKIMGDPFKLEPQKEMVLFRMLQESMNNAIKHSKAENLKVALQYDVHWLRLSIEDDGIGFDSENLPTARLGMGLKSMQSRASIIGGVFSVISGKGKGTIIKIDVKRTVI